MPTAYALIHEEDGVFGISFPDFPGCVSTGASEEEALQKGMQALSFHVAGMVEDGDPIPAPQTLAGLRASSSFREDAEGAVVALVHFDVPGRAIRLNISMEERLLELVDRAAAASGQSRSAFLGDAARQRLKGAA